MSVTIVPAGGAHLAGIVAIYNHAVAQTTAIWNDATVDVANRRDWWQARTSAGMPVLVALDAAGEVAGYGSFGPFRPFDGYRATVEHSVYVATDARRAGLGSALLGALEARARDGDMHVMIGGIAADNQASLALHRRHGFTESGRLAEVGQKFGRYLDLVFMQKLL